MKHGEKEERWKQNAAAEKGIGLKRTIFTSFSLSNFVYSWL